MPKNNAWSAYNETLRNLEEEYNAKIKPLRVALSNEITQTEKRFDDKIIPLQVEKKSAIEKLKSAYSESVTEAAQKRAKAEKVAREVLNAERESDKEAAKV